METHDQVDAAFPYTLGLPTAEEILAHEDKSPKVEGVRKGWWQRQFEGEGKPEIVALTSLDDEGTQKIEISFSNFSGGWKAPTIGGWEDEQNRYTKERLRMQDDSLWSYRPCTAKGTPVPRPLCEVRRQPGCQFELTLSHLTLNGVNAVEDALRQLATTSDAARDVLQLVLVARVRGQIQR